MNDFIEESQIIPYHVSDPPGKSVLVLAPHPDDETLGCGGTLRLLTDQGKKIKVVFLTSGDKADPSHHSSLISHNSSHITDYSLIREQEACKALKILGINEHSFFRFGDRELYKNYDNILAMLTEELFQITSDNEKSAFESRLLFDTLYSPSLLELNPDHRVAANLVLELQRRYECRVVFFEVAIPIRPNILINITKVIKTKWKAIKTYKTQLQLMDYLSINKSLNKFRTLTLNKEIQYAEAFLVLENVSEQEKLYRWFNYESLVEQ